MSHYTFEMVRRVPDLLAGLRLQSTLIYRPFLPLKFHRLQTNCKADCTYDRQDDHSQFHQHFVSKFRRHQQQHAKWEGIQVIGWAHMKKPKVPMEAHWTGYPRSMLCIINEGKNNDWFNGEHIWYMMTSKGELLQFTIHRSENYEARPNNAAYNTHNVANTVFMHVSHALMHKSRQFNGIKMRSGIHAPINDSHVRNSWISQQNKKPHENPMIPSLFCQSLWTAEPKQVSATEERHKRQKGYWQPKEILQRGSSPV